MSQDLGFIWDGLKREKVYRDHGVTYPEVVSAFLDLESWEESDDNQEERFCMIAKTERGRVLKIVYEEEYTESGSLIYRIITAFEAGEKYAQEYHRRRR